VSVLAALFVYAIHAALPEGGGCQLRASITLAALYLQLRNPLHAMHGAVLQLASCTLDAAAAAVEAASLAHGIDVMIQITNDMLDAEALRLGRLRIRPAPTDIRTVLAACAKADESVAVALDVSHDVPAFVVLDPLRFRQVCARLRQHCHWLVPVAQARVYALERARARALACFAHERTSAPIVVSNGATPAPPRLRRSC
jgi:hypothetical protein